ncbi:MAG: hypothetical protein [Microvirus sp.]|nr:MAG: hypothetical protein [Microvirus sp.]
MKAYDLLTGEALNASVMSNLTRPVQGRIPDGDSSTITEQGYIPPSALIQDMEDMGARILADRRARFDNRELELDDDEDVPLDPLREPGSDIVDVMRVAAIAKKRLEVVNTARSKAVELEVAKQNKLQLDAAVEAELSRREIAEKAIKNGVA